MWNLAEKLAENRKKAGFVACRDGHVSQAPVTPTDSVAYKAAAKAMEKTFGKTPIPLRTGGCISIVIMFERVQVQQSSTAALPTDGFVARTICFGAI